ncbi:hypothetical protein CON65_09815 [Bacillus pseudomycoides]|uniref:Uncharacterized protein n=1 Tax=Bacillus pseudomycoides TaxID=64104 RepID=A0AA91VD03_9BACI|nr:MULTISPECIES: hypothetical protein [Bacillus]PEB55526.1 hypothetical protein COO03_02230 [Bacillus sp. AFS098217]PED82822.1 hypothetical protein CON65_09815 [Bacillus pseudomycoides]PEU08176.1 hypothetical protein CN524_19125 [Bacillus sp. AFS019443]PEU18198.1 hypothetical protein CN525_12765 [Bacillus sp. AFS014408]PFW62954.1 hypothetical protein COL20_10830 [Bacillus sp. AFS075034]
MTKVKKRFKGTALNLGEAMIKDKVKERIAVIAKAKNKLKFESFSIKYAEPTRPIKVLASVIPNRKKMYLKDTFFILLVACIFTPPLLIMTNR